MQTYITLADHVKDTAVVLEPPAEHCDLVEPDGHGDDPQHLEGTKDPALICGQERQPGGHLEGDDDRPGNTVERLICAGVNRYTGLLRVDGRLKVYGQASMVGPP